MSRAARIRASALRRALRRQARETQEIFTGTFKQPRGLTRGIVTLQGCAQEVTAERPTDFRKGESVIVVQTAGGRRALLPGPPARPGPAAAGTVDLIGAQPAPPTATDAVFLVLFRFGGDLEYEAFAADGENLGAIGTSHTLDGPGCAVFPSVSDGLGPGTRLTLSGGDLVCADFLGSGPDYTGGSTFTYTPSSPWTATHAQKVGAIVFWWEWEAQTDTTTSARLRKSSSCKFTGATTVNTKTDVSPNVFVVPDWIDARGPDFTTEEGGVWLQLQDGESFEWVRVRATYDGATIEQSTTSRTMDLLESVYRAGHPASSSLALTQTSTDDNPLETTAYPAETWDGAVNPLYSTWASVGNVIDLAPDPSGSSIWVLRATTVEQRNFSGGLIGSAVTLQDLPGTPVGLHRLATAIPIETGNGE